MFSLLLAATLTTGAGRIQIDILNNSLHELAAQVEEQHLKDFERSQVLHEVYIPIEKDEIYQALMNQTYHGFTYIGKERRKVVEIASLYDGELSYSYGAKAGPGEGWALNEDKSLDCSGFTQYIYHSALGEDIGYGTYVQSEQGREISYEELKPGDLGFLCRGKVATGEISDENRAEVEEDEIYSVTAPESDESDSEDNISDEDLSEDDDKSSSFINHTGIYYGKGKNGEDLWIHCNATDGCVSIGPMAEFTYFVSYFDDNMPGDDQCIQ